MKTFFDTRQFWSRVVVQGKCWIWTGYPTTEGYAILSFGGRFWKAHRLSWVLAYGARIPKNKEVCHSCDTPLCVRPTHLFLGTRLENMQDAKRKGRLDRYNRKLQGVTACIVHDMRTMLKLSYYDLAELLGVGPMTVHGELKRVNS